MFMCVWGIYMMHVYVVYMCIMRVCWIVFVHVHVCKLRCMCGGQKLTSDIDLYLPQCMWTGSPVCCSENFEDSSMSASHLNVGTLDFICVLLYLVFMVLRISIQALTVSKQVLYPSAVSPAPPLYSWSQCKQKHSDSHIIYYEFPKVTYYP